ncbi:LysR substrate-binding domain-containing protein [Streptomyces sp. NPDC001982]|uniref:LysR substrate-binding domain-containing protein n=1 Tax=unclassified Streptomyces TaxID=2593676 RepID=UPI00333180A5
MELRHIEAFIAVAEELNFRRAAERLHIAQPPLSQQIKRLERDVGATLLFRTTRHVALTPAGEAFLYEARRAVQSVHAARRAATEVAAGRTGVVRLGFSGPASYEVLMLLTKKYREQRPKVRLDVVGPVYGSDLADRLSRGEIDASLVRLPVQGSRIAVREIARQDMAVALPADHPLADRPHVELRDLRDELVINYLTERGGAVPNVVQSAFLEHGFSPNVIQSAPDVHAIMSLVGAGAGIGFVPLSVSHIRLPGVVLVPVPEIPPLPLALAWSEDDPSQALSALVALVDDVSDVLRAGTGS